MRNARADVSSVNGLSFCTTAIVPLLSNLDI
jgi:hypothetical protein